MIGSGLRLAAALAALGLAACSSLPLDTAIGPQTVDYLNEDLSGLVVAFDVPVTLEPVPDGSTFSFKVGGGGADERHVEAVLVAADATEIVGRLPPPAEGRTYYFFGFSARDKTALGEAQVYARTLPQERAGLGVSLEPRFCSTAGRDPSQFRISLLAVLPGRVSAAPLIRNRSLQTLMPAGSPPLLPVCAGHSG